MRTKRAFTNIAVASLCNVVVIATTFWAKRVFVSYIGYELLGVVNVFTALMSMLSLSELGLGTASVQALYRPLAVGDTVRVAAIERYCGRLYRIISLSVLVLGAAAFPILPRLIMGEYDFSYLTSLYIPFVLGAASSYWAASRKNVILAAQKGYIISGIQLATRLAASLTQVLIITYLRDYRYYLYAKILFDLIENMAAYILCGKRFPFTRGSRVAVLAEDRAALSSNIFSLAFHRVGAYLINGTDNIVISVFLGERIVAFCSASVLVIGTVTDFLGQILGAMSSGLGNLMAMEKEDHVLRVFRRILMAQHFLASFCCISLFVLMDPFISVWLGAEAVLPWQAKLVLIVNFYIIAISQPLGTLRSAAGVFRPDRYLHVGLAVLNIVLSVALVKPMGAAGVYLGTTACLVVKEIATLPHIVDRHILGRFTRFYYPALLGYAALTVAEALAVEQAASLVTAENQYVRLLLKAALCICIPFSVNGLVLSRTGTFRELADSVKNILLPMLTRRTKPSDYPEDEWSRRRLRVALSAVAAFLTFIGYLIYAFLFLRDHFLICLSFSFGLLLLSFVLGYACVMRFSEESLLSALIRCRYSICLVLFVYFVAWGAHGLSLNTWDAYFSNSAQAPDPILLFGNPNAITSDVWGILVPQFISQARHGFPFYNPDLMSAGANAVLYGLPVRDVTMIGRPCLWGFFFLDTGRALAWMYWGRLFGLLLSGYEILNLLTSENRRLSAIGGALIAFGSMTQWWAGHVLSEVLLYGQCIVACLIAYIGGMESPKRKCAAAAGLAVFVLGFAVTISPALQVSVGYMVLLFAAGLLWDARVRIKNLFSLFDAVLAAAIAVLVCAATFHLFWISREDIFLLLNTEYPGTRISVGAEYPPGKFFYYIYQWLLPISSSFYNNCESSMFLPFLPAVLIAFLMAHQRDKNAKLLPVLLYRYMMFCIIWLFIPFPEWFASGTLFSFVTGERALWAIGAISVYLGIYCLSVPRREERGSSYRPAVIISGGITLLFLAVTLIYRDFLNIFDRFASIGAEIPAIIKIMVVTATLIAWFVFIFFYITVNKRICAVLLCGLMLVCGFSVNPLSLGTDAITSKQVVIDVQAIDRGDPGSLWLYNGTFPKSLILTASGVRSFNAVNMYPDWEKWQSIDPGGAHSEIYNRYAHVSAILGASETSFHLEAEDAVRVELSASDLKALGVRYIVSEESLDGVIPGIEEIIFNEADGLWVYKY